MESGADALINSLPNDLADFVLSDNKAFQDEKIKWNAEQEEKKNHRQRTSLSREGVIITLI